MLCTVWTTTHCHVSATRSWNVWLKVSYYQLYHLNVTAILHMFDAETATNLLCGRHLLQTNTVQSNPHT